MAASWAVKHLGVVEDIAAGQIPGGIDLAPDALALEQLKEALDHSVSWQLPRRLMLARVTLGAHLGSFWASSLRLTSV